MRGNEAFLQRNAGTRGSRSSFSHRYLIYVKCFFFFRTAQSPSKFKFSFAIGKFSQCKRLYWLELIEAYLLINHLRFLWIFRLREIFDCVLAQCSSLKDLTQQLEAQQSLDAQIVFNQTRHSAESRCSYCVLFQLSSMLKVFSLKLSSVKASTQQLEAGHCIQQSISMSHSAVYQYEVWRCSNRNLCRWPT